MIIALLIVYGVLTVIGCILFSVIGIIDWR